MMSFIKRSQPRKPTTGEKLATMGQLVVAAYAIQVGVQILDASIKGAARGAANVFGKAKDGLAARKAAALNAAEAQAEEAEEGGVLSGMTVEETVAMIERAEAEEASAAQS